MATRRKREHEKLLLNELLCFILFSPFSNEEKYFQRKNYFFCRVHVFPVFFILYINRSKFLFNLSVNKGLVAKKVKSFVAEKQKLAYLPTFNGVKFTFNNVIMTSFFFFIYSQKMDLKNCLIFFYLSKISCFNEGISEKNRKMW